MNKLKSNNINNINNINNNFNFTKTQKEKEHKILSYYKTISSRELQNSVLIQKQTQNKIENAKVYIKLVAL
jgi:hypothetical protein